MRGELRSRCPEHRHHVALDEGKTVSQVARDLDLTASALSTWVKVGIGEGRAASTQERIAVAWSPSGARCGSKDFSTYKSEVGEHFASDREVKNKTFDYIESFYNTTRRHSALDYMSPARYERLAEHQNVA